MKTENLRIGSTDIILMDYSEGSGKIIISNDGYGYNFSYYWGAMGKDTTLAQFICHISTDYFVGKLGPYEKGDIDLSKTMRNVRGFWKKEGIPWYKEMDLQKDLRREFKSIESMCDDDRHFVDMMSRLKDSFYFSKHTVLSTGYVIKDDFEDALDHLCSEPWDFIVNKDHKQNIWLAKFHLQLKEELAKLTDKKEAA